MKRKFSNFMGHSFFNKTLITIFISMLVSIQYATAQPEESETPLTYEEISTNQLMEAISSWAGAWQSQLPDLYITHYVIYYKPPDFDSRDQWVENRRTRLILPEFISLRLIDFELIALSDNEATVRFSLIYERPDYSDQTYKELVFQGSNGFWLIKEENNLETVVL
ncbi:MAG: hypothetical protein P8M72_01160 [Gammaproteobacteria bacterium]|nr:hypothetical protein [Gammaproteobacteria bacterium]